ncbi:unnamed protein product [Pleuronectes platessa]|uniref:Uncharacterized protein n=1 Tax=Pleuronectes platessa TaxID=8262 RepID=A0A9N7UZ31_PLEPL|nr:unnamed protein product [Pleuronectes platessa]
MRPGGADEDEGDEGEEQGEGTEGRNRDIEQERPRPQKLRDVMDDLGSGGGVRDVENKVLSLSSPIHLKYPSPLIPPSNPPVPRIGDGDKLRHECPAILTPLRASVMEQLDMKTLLSGALVASAHVVSHQSVEEKVGRREWRRYKSVRKLLLVHQYPSFETLT